MIRIDIWWEVTILKNKHLDLGKLVSNKHIRLAVVAGLVVVAVVSIIVTQIEKRNCDARLATEIEYLKSQYNNFIEFNDTEAAKSLIRKAESAKLIVDCDEATTTNELKRHADELAATGISIINSNFNTTAEYTKDGVGFEQFRNVLNEETILKVMQYDNYTYMKRIKLEDSSYLDLAIKQCEGGALLVYRHTDRKFAIKSMLSVQDILDGFDPEQNGTFVITDGKQIIASNNEDFDPDNISEENYKLVYNFRHSAKADKMFTLKKDGEPMHYFGRYSHGREYYICAFLSERQVYKNTLPIVAITIVIYILSIAVVQFMRLRTTNRLISEQKEQEHLYQLELEKKNIELTKAVDTAEAANRSKRAFLFNMSHDIRTPMNAIIGFTNLAEQNINDKKKLSDYLDKIMVSSKHLLALINDILDMSRIESGKVNIEAVPVCILDQLQLVMDVIHSDIEAHGLNYVEQRVDLDDIYVYADALHVNRVLINILSNAVKFTPEGGTITLTLRERKSEHEGHAYYDFIIEDTGIGMSEEFQKRIFEQFAREKTSTVSRTQGTGLGMSITKSLVDLMNGDITVESELGKGTVFTVSLEFMLTTENMVLGSAVEQEIHTKEDIAGKRVLLAEDNELNMEIAISILEAMGLEVDTAIDGSVALDKIESQPAGFYDLVLMDIQMPMMNGYESTKAIRTLDDPKKANIPIVAMTANAFEEDKKAAFAVGMNDHIAKPLDVDVITQVITEQLKQHSERDSAEEIAEEISEDKDLEKIQE